MLGKWTLVRRFLALLLYDLGGTPKLARVMGISCRMQSFIPRRASYRMVCSERNTHAGYRNVRLGRNVTRSASYCIAREYLGEQDTVWSIRKGIPWRASYRMVCSDKNTLESKLPYGVFEEEYIGKQATVWCARRKIPRRASYRMVCSERNTCAG